MEDAGQDLPPHQVHSVAENRPKISLKLFTKNTLTYCVFKHIVYLFTENKFFYRYRHSILASLDIIEEEVLIK